MHKKFGDRLYVDLEVTERALERFFGRRWVEIVKNATHDLGPDQWEEDQEEDEDGDDF